LVELDPQKEVSVLDSKDWKVAQAAAKMPFQLDGDAIPTSTTSSRRSWISATDGVIARVEPSTVWIEGDSLVSLKHSVPVAFELSALLGRRVRIALLHVSSVDGGLAQTLTITSVFGNPLVIAHCGEARALSHTLGSVHVYVALSQRPGGPMVFGTSRLQSIVRAGDHIRVRVPDEHETYVMQFESRRGREATYAIGVEDIWKGPPSTMR
jgi:hypothetical protein